jgi:hypothetical protein
VIGILINNQGCCYFAEIFAQVGRPDGYIDEFFHHELKDAPDPCFQGVGFVMDLQVPIPPQSTAEVAFQPCCCWLAI